jgi:hypothetical protein
MMNTVIFAAVLTASSFGMTYLLTNFAPAAIKDNQMLAILLGFIGFCVSIYITAHVAGFHV